MKPIIQLDQSLINKIAAGEVVERPLSVVKELTENAIDAGATVITVEITDGGLSQIRVTDNGSGIPAEDLELAFSRHATSKIASIDDLFEVATLGFRGEALSSIASVSQVEMITKTHQAVMGIRVEIHGGQVLSGQKIGCANGTTVVVSNLFFNTPARRKFLKKPAAEAGLISDCLERLALGNPRLTLRYINNGKIIFQSKGNGELKNVLLDIYGREVATNVVRVDANDSAHKLHGFAGKPMVARSNRRHGTFFINGRYIQSKLLSNAVEDAMNTMLPQGKFPLYVLNLEIPFDMLDVNVHPTKMDVRFADEEAVFEFVRNAVRETLMEENLIPTQKVRNIKKEEPPESEQLSFGRPSLPQNVVAREAENDNASAGLHRNFRTEASKKIPTATEVENALREMYTTSSNTVSAKEKTDAILGLTRNFPNTSLPEKHAAQSPSPKTTKLSPFVEGYNIVGLIFNTYWLTTSGESLYLIDQHAAHERILYEEFLAKAKERKIQSQQLLMPIPLRLTPREKQLLDDNIALFNEFGFDVEDYALTAVPLLMSGPPSSGFFAELLDKIDQVGFSKESVYSHKTELIAMASCKAAVKGGDGLNPAEAESLIKRLLELENPFTCPHGRPTIIEITKQELEKRFKRS